MFSDDDRALVQRDTALPGLGALLDTDRFAERLRDELPDRRVTIVCFFPHDDDVRGLRRLGSLETRRRLFSRALPDRPELWDATIYPLACKPERRFVARIGTDGGVVKLYTRSGYGQLDAAGTLHDRGSTLRLPEMRGRLDRHCVIVWEWLPGRLLSEALANDEVDADAMCRVGAALAELHTFKTALVSLLLQLFQPDSGTISVDGHDLRDLRTSSLRRQFSVVLQDTLLFAGTIRDNIVCGLDEVTDHDVAEAAQLAEAYDFILALPQGYQTPVGERGVTLSAGQRQRIAVARAAIRHAPLIVLDEPTTGLDDVSKAQVMDALDRLTCGRTTFFITREVKLAQNKADLVAWIEQGRVVEFGTPTALIASGGRFARALFEPSSAKRARKVHAFAG